MHTPSRLSLLLTASLLSAPVLATAEEAAPPTTPDEESTRPQVPLPPEPPPSQKPASSNLLLESLRLEITGQIFALWSIDVAQANPDLPSPNGANRFDLTRAFVDVTPQISDRISARITPDLFRVSNTGGNVDGTLALRLFYAYVRWADIAPGVSAIGGLQPNPLTSFDDSVWKYRVLGPSIYSTFAGLPTSDLGVGVTGKQLDGVLEYHVLLSNGEGRDKPEVNKYKEGTARVTFAPFANGDAAWAKRLRLTALADYGIQSKFDGDKIERIQVSGLASFEHEVGTVAVGAGPTWQGAKVQPPDAAPFVETRHGLLFTTYAFVNLPLNLRALGRFDFLDPDLDDTAGTRATTGRRTRTIGGLAYRFTDKVQLIADYQHFGYQRPENALATDPGSTFFLHTEARY